MDPLPTFSLPSPYPQEWTGEKELADALVVTAERLPLARFVITTLGRRGSVMLIREKESPQAGRELKEVLSGLEKELGQAPELWGSDQEACVSRTGVHVRCETSFTEHDNDNHFK